MATAAEQEKLVEEGYDQIALKYHNQRDRFSHKKELEQFCEHLPKGGKVLDAGCGAGVPVAKMLSEKGFKVTGIDVSKRMIALAKKHVPNGEFMKMSMTDLDFKDNTFDGLTAFYSIIHVPKEKHGELFRKFHQIIKKNGAILMTLGSTAYEGVEDFHGTDMFWSHLSPEESLSLVKIAGFEIIWEKQIIRGSEKHYWVLARNKK